MKKIFWLVLLVGITVGVRAGDFQPVNRDNGNDTTQPIGPVSDGPGGTTVLPGPGIVTAAVPEPSALSLITGTGIIGSWLLLRRRL
jgi:hypothetical protein